MIVAIAAAMSGLLDSLAPERKAAIVNTAVKAGIAMTATLIPSIVDILK